MPGNRGDSNVYFCGTLCAEIFWLLVVATMPDILAADEQKGNFGFCDSPGGNSNFFPK
jgi:hypothetical protein